jgi:hypothetical protein
MLALQLQLSGGPAGAAPQRLLDGTPALLVCAMNAPRPASSSSSTSLKSRKTPLSGCWHL